MEESQREFLAEAEDLVEQLLSDIDELRAKRSQGRLRRELLDRIFRHVHSVKGLGASAGFMDLSEQAHEFESLLASVRSGHINLDDSVLENFEAAAASLSDCLVQPQVQAFAPSPTPQHISATQDQNVSRKHNIEAVLNELPNEIWESLNDEKKNRLHETLSEGAGLFFVRTSFDVANFEEYFERLENLLTMQGELISTAPAVDSLRPDKIDFRILYARSASAEAVRKETADIPGVTVTEVIPKSAKDSSAGGAADSGPRAFGSLTNFIRTDLEDLDRLISSTHELFRITKETLEFAKGDGASSEFQTELEQQDIRIRQSFRALEEEIIRLRMVAVDRVLKRAARAGQSAARYRGKEVEIEIVGGAARLDKLLCDAIADPLVHLVRNAVDHGIESVEERLAAGKRPIGKVTIQFWSEGSRNRLRVSDDGRGIDPIAVSRAAAAQGLVDENVIIDMDRALRLIFRPGFSSADSQSSVSGRGVGLDVVESAIEHVGGDLRVSTVHGEGTTFEIRLPVTVDLLDAVIVLSAGSRYVVPASVVLSQEAINPAQLAADAPTPSIPWESANLPYVYMRELLDQPPNDTNDSQPLNALICEFPDEGTVEGSRRSAFIVDAIEGTEEVLVRSLGQHAARWTGVAGASELRDGTIALVLDLPRLLNHQ